MNTPPVITLLAALVLPASATVTIDYVTIGNPGNAPDPATGSLYGAVAYEYQIGKYEVTNAQYAEFLNAKASATDSYSLYNTNMASCGITRSGSSGGFSYSVTGALANRPVVYVSWFNAVRFANWLANGQGGGDTETGSYILNGALSGIITAIAGAQVYIPTEDEWYKAAYYNGTTSTYSLYPNGQDVISMNDANYGNSVGASTDVGSYSGDPSNYGTFDQGGNVWEWNDAVIGSSRGLRGGSWYDGSGGATLDSSFRFDIGVPSGEHGALGFRVASVASVPEPSALILTMFAGGAMFIRRKR